MVQDYLLLYTIYYKLSVLYSRLCTLHFYSKRKLIMDGNGLVLETSLFPSMPIHLPIPCCLLRTKILGSLIYVFYICQHGLVHNLVGLDFNEFSLSILDGH